MHTWGVPPLFCNQVWIGLALQARVRWLSSIRHFYDEPLLALPDSNRRTRSPWESRYLHSSHSRTFPSLEGNGETWRYNELTCSTRKAPLVVIEERLAPSFEGMIYIHHHSFHRTVLPRKLFINAMLDSIVHRWKTRKFTQIEV